MDGIVISPQARDPAEVPLVSLTDFIFEHLKNKLPSLGDRPWVVDTATGKCVKFNELEEKTRRVASALSRRGLKKGDILYFVTYEMAELVVLLMAVWRLGAAVRGCFQTDEPEEYARQLGETGSRFVLIDEVTAPVLREAISQLDWSVQLLSVGDVTPAGATSFSELLKDDGTAFPKQVQINAKKDMLLIPNSSGSTGRPKGAIHTHFNAVAMLYSIKHVMIQINVLSTVNNFAAANFYGMLSSLQSGSTLLCVTQLKKETFFDILLKYKPDSINMYPYIAAWFARSPELGKHDFTFLRGLTIAGSVLDITTADLLTKQLPHLMLNQAYAQSELMGTSFTIMNKKTYLSLKKTVLDGETYLSCGGLMTYVQAKVVDPNTGETLGRNKFGEILIRAPYIMLGYLRQGQEPDLSDVDEEGFYHSGDIGFFDDDGEIYIRDRKSFMFKSYMEFVSPSEIESVLQEHEAVQAAGVVGVPNPETTNLARGFVVLNTGASVTCQELQEHVARRLLKFKHLHGGVRIVDSLPLNRGNKLDRAKLLHMALEEDNIRKNCGLWD